MSTYTVSDLPEYVQQFVGEYGGEDEVVWLSWSGRSNNYAKAARPKAGKECTGVATPVSVDELTEGMVDDLIHGRARLHEPEWRIPVTSAHYGFGTPTS